MDFAEYQTKALQTDRHKDRTDEKLRVSPLGLVGEVGSLAAVYKKFLRDGKAYQAFRSHFVEELGDVLWYVASLAYSFGIDSSKLKLTPSPQLSDFPFEALVKLETIAAALFESRLVGKTIDATPLIYDAVKSLTTLGKFVEAPIDEIMISNLEKVKKRWGLPEDREAKRSAPCFDSDFPEEEKLPRVIDVSFVERKTVGKSNTVIMQINGLNIGDRITDNSGESDGYRFHDAFHWGYVAVLGWSPVIRSLLKSKRKSDSEKDEVDDGARAIIAEECISLQVFSYAEANNFFADLDRVDHDLLKLIQNLTRDLEIHDLADWEWEKAIIEGFRAFQFLKSNAGGVLHIDANERRITYSKD